MNQDISGQVRIYFDRNLEPEVMDIARRNDISLELPGIGGFDVPPEVLLAIYQFAVVTPGQIRAAVQFYSDLLSLTLRRRREKPLATPTQISITRQKGRHREQFTVTSEEPAVALEAFEQYLRKGFSDGKPEPRHPH